MISGFTTSVSHAGTTYQVQTEDKGPSASTIVTSIYVAGRVLLTKRTHYDDVLAGDFDRERLERSLRHQHKVICAAVGSGRLQDLKRLTESERVRKVVNPSAAAGIPQKADVAKPAAAKPRGRLSVKVDRRIRFRAGDDRQLEVRVVRGSSEDPVRGAQVSIKVVGSGFRPQIFHAGTDSKGSAKVNLRLPVFRSGRGAVVIRASEGETEAELRRVIRPY